MAADHPGGRLVPPVPRRGGRQRAPDGIAAANADGRIVSANWQFGQLYGLSPAEAAGLTLEAVVARAWQDSGEAAPAQLLAHLRESQHFAGAPFEVPLPASAGSG